jgi:hypothetical protein
MRTLHIHIKISDWRVYDVGDDALGALHISRFPALHHVEVIFYDTGARSDKDLKKILVPLNSRCDKSGVRLVASAQNGTGIRTVQLP